MRKSLFALAAAALLWAPFPVHASALLEGSIGSGVRFEPSPTTRIPTSLLLTLGYSFPSVKLEVGAIGYLSDVKGSSFDLGLRPMVVLSLPGFPVYLRGIVNVTGLVDTPTHVGYGGALGVRLGAAGLGAFLEAGALSGEQTISGSKESTWLAEARLGFYWD